MQYCTRCGNLIQEGEEYCSKCGQPVSRGQTPETLGRAPVATPTGAPSTGGGGATILGILGIIIGFLLVPLAGIILGIIAIGLGSSAVKRGDRNGNTGVLLGTIAVAISVLTWIMGFILIFSM